MIHPEVQELLPKVSRPILTYGFSEKADFHVTDYSQEGTKTKFVVNRPKGQSPLSVTLNLPGRHNVSNALAAIAVASELKVKDSAICEALIHFAGIGRRFQLYGDYELSGGGKVTLVDDYGHHPREVEATISAARESWPDRRLVMVYQPHRYTRTHDLFDDFCKVLTGPDRLLLLNVYSAGEDPIEGADSQTLAKSLKDSGKASVLLVDNHQQLPALFASELKDGDVVLMQGAGNIGAIAADFGEKGFDMDEASRVTND